MIIGGIRIEAHRRILLGGVCILVIPAPLFFMGIERFKDYAPSRRAIYFYASRQMSVSCVTRFQSSQQISGTLIKRLIFERKENNYNTCLPLLLLLRLHLRGDIPDLPSVSDFAMDLSAKHSASDVNRAHVTESNMGQTAVIIWKRDSAKIADQTFDI